jgi:hypothetical protein
MTEPRWIATVRFEWPDGSAMQESCQGSHRECLDMINRRRPQSCWQQLPLDVKVRIANDYQRALPAPCHPSTFTRCLATPAATDGSFV